VAKLLASVGFGALWTLFGPETAVAVFGAGLLVMLPLGGRLLRRPEPGGMRA
jgi:hypothetical protein